MCELIRKCVIHEQIPSSHARNSQATGVTSTVRTLAHATLGREHVTNRLLAKRAASAASESPCGVCPHPRAAPNSPVAVVIQVSRPGKSSSYMRLNKLMQWFTGNIGYHHVHHMNVLIPFYRLPEAMAAIPELQSPATTSLAPREILACFR